MERTLSSSGARARPLGGSELFAWYFMRVSGLALIFLALGHLVIMHLINNVDNIDYAFVVTRWATPFWRTYDALMLVLALVHGLNGARVIVDDYFRGGWRVVIQSVLMMGGLVLMVLGSIVVATFQPQ